MKSCKAVSEILGGRRQVNAKGLLREVQAAEEGLEATRYRKRAERHSTPCPFSTRRLQLGEDS